mgnify:CR=1 FL=1
MGLDLLLGAELTLCVRWLIMWFAAEPRDNGGSQEASQAARGASEGLDHSARPGVGATLLLLSLPWQVCVEATQACPQTHSVSI